MGAPVIHFEIGVKNDKKGVEFYSKVFDWDISREVRINYISVNAEKNGIGGGIVPVGESNFSPYVTIYIEVDNIQKYLDRVETQGGRKFREPIDIPRVGKIGWFHDSDNNLIGLWEKE